MSSRSDRQNELKATVRGHGTTVVDQRINRRKHLVERFKSLRVHVLDNLRGIKADDLDYVTLVEVKNILSDFDPKGLVNLQEFNEIKIEVEEELKHLEAEQHASVGEEAHLIADRLMEKCIVCGLLINGYNICGNCQEIYFTSN